MLILCKLCEGERVPYICASTAWLAEQCRKQFTISDVSIARLRGTAWGPA